MGRAAHRSGLSAEPGSRRPVVIVAGPTASGKSALALDLARILGGTVINADSMQVYRELRVLTARPSPEEEAEVPHRLYGVLSAAEACSAARWRALALEAIQTTEDDAILPELKSLLRRAAPAVSINTTPILGFGIHAYDFTSDGSVVALVGKDGSVGAWDLVTGARRLGLPSPDLSCGASIGCPDVFTVALSGDGSLLAAGDGLYAGTADGAYRLDQGGDHWSVVTSGLDDILVHALVKSSDGTLFAGTSGKGVLRFKANSAGWTRMEHGLKDHEGMIENFIRVLTIDPEGGIYAGTFDGGVFRSADGGMTWRPISRALPNDSIRGIVFNSRGLFVATGHGIFKTTDKGRQWVPLNKGLTSMAVQVLVESPNGSLYAGTNEGAFRSDDDGNSWSAINQGLEGGIAPPPFLFR